MKHLSFQASGSRRRLLALAAVPLLPACVSPVASPEALSAVPTAVLESSTRYTKQYVLVPGDQIEVVVWRAPEVSRTVVVRGDGRISLPLVQDVPAAGLTAAELAARLTEQFSTRLNQPQVSVVPVAVRQPTVYVLGDVGLPQAVPLRSAATALQAITIAGGLRRTGAEAEVSVIRLGDDGRLRATVVSVSGRGQPAPYMVLAALPLQADDVVFVPESGRAQLNRFLDDFVIKPLQTILSYKLIASV